MRKPRLTATMVGKLRELASFATAAAEAEADSPVKDQAEHAEHVIEAAGWVFDLCAWYESKHEDNHMRP